MGEIKSTLDIIMEKTRGMTLTDEEKMEIRKREVEGKVQGLVQKLVDGVLDVSRLQAELAALEGEKRLLAEGILRREVIERMDPLLDNSLLLEVIRDVLGVDPAPLAQLLSDFRETLALEASHRESLLREELQERGISGDAVRPNLRADPEWGSYLLKKTEELRQELSSL